MLSIIIPVYNEKEAVKDVVNSLITKVNSLEKNMPFEIIIVNDGSCENTKGILDELSINSVVKVIHNIINIGYGYSLKRGIYQAQYDTVLIIDGDGSYPIENLDNLLKIYHQGYDLIVASRGGSFVEDSFIKTVFRWFLRRLVEFTAGTSIPDVNSGMRIFSKKTIIRYFDLLSDRFSFTTSMTLIYSLEKKIIHFEKNGYNKRKGKSKVNLRKDIFRTLQIIVEIIARKNPLKLHLALIILNVITVFVYSAIYFLINKHFDWSITHVFLIIFFFQISMLAYAVQNKR